MGAYVDAYYAWNFNEPEGNNTPYFVSSSRHNEATINLAYIDLKLSEEHIRARFMPGFGTYVNANYAAEQGTLKGLLEASVGVRLTKKREIWLDGGILGSPYTNETAISGDQLMYTRSLAPEYVPYYVSGLRLNFPLSQKALLNLFVLNGWQQIADLNGGKALGTQVEMRPNERNTINWNTYIGNEGSEVSPSSRNRYFTDVFWLYDRSERFSLATCAYIGVQEKIDSSMVRRNDVWWQANITGRYWFTQMLSLSARVEYFSDPYSVQISPLSGDRGFETYSGSGCMTINVSREVMFRIEARHFYSARRVYMEQGLNSSDQMIWLVTNLTASF